MAYVEKAAGEHADPERIRLYCENSVEHFEWFRALGVEYKASFYDHKVTHPTTDDSLVYTGNEQAWPHADASTPVPRGHKPAREGEAGGYLMEAVLAVTLWKVPQEPQLDLVPLALKDRLYNTEHSCNLCCTGAEMKSQIFYDLSVLGSTL